MAILKVQIDQTILVLLAFRAEQENVKITILQTPCPHLCQNWFTAYGKKCRQHPGFLAQENALPVESPDWSVESPRFIIVDDYIYWLVGCGVGCVSKITISHHSGWL
jgi:hypothetical protein